MAPLPAPIHMKTTRLTLLTDQCGTTRDALHPHLVDRGLGPFGSSHRLAGTVGVSVAPVIHVRLTRVGHQDARVGREDEGEASVSSVRGGPGVQHLHVVRPFERRRVAGGGLRGAAAQLGRPTRSRARPSTSVSSASTTREVVGAVAEQRRGDHRDVGADHQRLHDIGAASGRPRSRRARRRSPSCGRRMAIQRSGRRSSPGWLSSTRLTTSSVSRSRSGW